MTDDVSGATVSTLVVDLDGTLTPTDTLVESLVRMVRNAPWLLLLTPLWLLQGRSAFKVAVARHVKLSAIALPYRHALIEWLRAERMRGRRIVLATAAHQDIAQGVSEHLQLFDAVLATTPGNNLKGQRKLEAILREVGPDFVYAGDSSADIPIWQAARAAVLVDVPARVERQIGRSVPVEMRFSEPKFAFRLWGKALRVHQWAKNLLLFVPMLTAFAFDDAAALVTIAWAFVAFSLAASATYIVNDLWDLDNDRAHPRKRNRPFASGALPPLHGVAVAAMLLVAGLAVAAQVGLPFFLVLLSYLVLTSAYSWSLKGYVLLDVLMLAALYTLRIVAGAVALAVPLSSWLLAFSVFVFLSLALVKRCAELVLLQDRQQEATSGRDYRVRDLTVLWPLGVGSALSAVVVFGLFISAPATVARYGTPDLLWAVALGLVYWLGRLWIKTARGEMHDDPMVYTALDRGSQITLLSMAVAMLAARLLHLN